MAKEIERNPFRSKNGVRGAFDGCDDVAGAYAPAIADGDINAGGGIKGGESRLNTSKASNNALFPGNEKGA
jgi:hypothetical protein